MKFTEDIIIGLEIHVELDTKTKLFCSCSTQGSDTPNTRVCEICLGMPGSKPVVNKKCVEYGIKIALGLNCKLAKSLIFSRKSYFYPDMSKNYQITQYEIPLGSNGSLEINKKKIGITRAHLEEDPASLIHPAGIDNSKYCLVDYNRCGNPLCEIVTEPQMHSPEEARDFMKSLVTVLRYLKVFDPSKNIIKADANISIKESGYIRAEIKNISGFKEIERALSYELLRQKQAVSEGLKLTQETRAWDSQKGITYLLRSKETEEDYGYITDPDLVPIEFAEKWLKELKSQIPEMPNEKAKRYVKEFKLSEEDASVITNDYNLTEIFENANKKVTPVLAAKWIRRELVRALNYNKIELSEMKLNQEQFFILLMLLDKNKITEKIAQKLIEKLVSENIDIEKYVKEHDMAGTTELNLVEAYCNEAIKENPKAVSDFKAGKQEALNFLFGYVMKKSKGKADPKEVKDFLAKMI